MIYPSDLQHLCTSWSERISDHNYPPDYRDALSECLFDINSLIDKTVMDEMTEKDAMDYILSQQADTYLSSMEAYDKSHYLI